MNPLVSIVITTYGEPIKLINTIESAINQTYPNIEIIVVDDNDPESEYRSQTQKIMQRYKSKDKVRYILHMQNMNGAAARNTGVVASKGKYIAFLDSDDEYMTRRIERCVKEIENHESLYGGVYTGCVFIKRDKEYAVVDKISSGNFKLDVLKCSFRGFSTGSNLFIKSEIVRELDGFDTSFQRHQDYEFLVRFFRKYNLLAIPEPLVKKNMMNRNVPNVEKMIEIKKHFWDVFKDDIDMESPENKKSVYQLGYIKLCENALSEKKAKIARELYRTACEYGGIAFFAKVRLFLLFVRTYCNIK